MTMLLGNAGKYNLLFFPQQSPEQCINVQSATIAPGQCKLLRDWANVGMSTHSQPVPDVSKDHLKAALEKLKPKILMKLESIHDKGDDSLNS